MVLFPDGALADRVLEEALRFSNRQECLVKWQPHFTNPISAALDTAFPLIPVSNHQPILLARPFEHT